MTMLGKPSQLFPLLLRILFVSFFLAPSIQATSRNETPWDAGVSLYIDSGKYGTDTRTTTTYIPFSITRYFEPGDVELVVPYISVNTQGQVILVGGVPNPDERGRGSTTGSAPHEVHRGLGDMLLRGRYYLLEEQSFIPAIDLLGEVKFPTASRTKGLGTGEFDEGGSLDFTKTFNGPWLGLAEVGYTVIGSPPGMPLNNQWHFSLGPGYYVIPKLLLVSLSYEESRSLTPEGTNPIDLLGSAIWRINSRVRVKAGLSIGLSNGAPDYSFDFGGHLRF